MDFDKTPSILTSKGQYYPFLTPEVYAFDIEEIAHALSHMNRFAGHTYTFYSVAQHCVIASYLVERGFEMEALLHDASEAYVVDVPSPLKKIIGPVYNEIEGKCQAALSKQFGIRYPFPEPVHKIDMFMLALEKRDLMVRDSVEWPFINGIDVSPHQPITPVGPREARQMFLDRYDTLRKRK